MININYIHATLLVLLYVHIGASIYSIYIHRGLSHGAVKFDSKVIVVFQCWLWLFGTLANRYRVDSHKLHHKYSDTERDINGPKMLGMVNILLIKPIKRFAGIVTAPFRKSTFVVNLEIEKIVDKKPDTGIFYNYIRWGIWINLTIHIILFGWVGLAIWLVMMFLAQWVAFAFADGVIHLWGYRNFPTDDCSKNVVPLGILFGGEELHNNHHKYPYLAKFNAKWWEVDIGWLYIRVLEKLKLAQVRNK